MDRNENTVNWLIAIAAALLILALGMPMVNTLKFTPLPMALWLSLLGMGVFWLLLSLRLRPRSSRQVRRITRNREKREKRSSLDKIQKPDNI